MNPSPENIKAHSVKQVVSTPTSVSRHMFQADIIKNLERYDLIIVPGLDNSDSQHWQSIWENELKENGISVERIKQRDWSRPKRQQWQRELERIVERKKKPVILIAHSLGAIIGADFQHECIAGALLVAPADIERCRPAQRARLENFGSMPMNQLMYPAVLVASRNDEWLSFPRACWLAAQWNTEIFDAGETGHIGNGTKLGIWIDGVKALQQLLDIIKLREGQKRHRLLRDKS
ncbi:MAG: alpha/beta fold hydrolase [Acetobacter sp.]|nr:alpha/beta fold hydrolase [Acetobacter sp.]